MFYLYLEKSYKKFEKKDDAIREFRRQFERREKNNFMITLKLEDELIAKYSPGLEGGMVEFGANRELADEVMCALIRSHEAN